MSSPPLTELEALLPTFAGTSSLERHVLTADDLANSYDAAPVFDRIFTITGRTADDFKGASASGPISVLALRLRGVEAQVLADAFVDASLAEHPDGVVAAGKIGGRDARTMRWPGVALLAGRTITVMVTGTVVLVATAETIDDQALVVDALTTMFQPKLEGLLPATLDGRTLARGTFPGGSVGTSGDICCFVCPGEPQTMAAKLRINIADVDFAVGYLESPPGIVIVAMRFPGAPTKDLVAARAAAFAQTGFKPYTEKHEIAGKEVVFAVYGPFQMFGQEEYLYAHDHVLFSIRVDPGIEPVPAIVTAAIKALP